MSLLFLFNLRVNLVQFLFFIMIYTILEYSNSFYPNLINNVIKNTTSINPYNMSNITGFVHFSITGAHYPTIYDEYLNLTVFGAVIKRFVQYCQYKEKKEPLSLFTTSSDIFTYPVAWVSKYINSSKFQDKNFINPPLEVIVNETITRNDVQIGNLTIPSKFYKNIFDFFYFDPDENGVNNFTYSNASSDFEFISRGYFYHSVTNKSSIKHIMKIKKEIKSTQEDDDDISYEVQENFFGKCHSGDVRIRYVLYGPINVTYFGYVENYTLKVKTISEVPFGTTKRGVKKDLKSLVNTYAPINNFDYINYYYFVNPQWTIKFVIIISILKFGFMHFRDHPMKFSYWIVAISLFNFTYRSLIWNKDIFDLKIWFTALMVHLIAGFATGVWKISSNLNHIINHQNREDHPHEQNNNEQIQNQGEQNFN